MKLLFTRTRDNRRQGVTVLAGMVGQEPGQIALQRGLAFPSAELHMKGLQEVGQRREWLSGSPR